MRVYLGGCGYVPNIAYENESRNCISTIYLPMPLIKCCTLNMRILHEKHSTNTGNGVSLCMNEECLHPYRYVTNAEVISIVHRLTGITRDSSNVSFWNLK